MLEKNIPLKMDGNEGRYNALNPTDRLKLGVRMCKV